MTTPTQTLNANPSDDATPRTIIDAFLAVARNPGHSSLPVVECATEQWTYEELDMISTGISLELHERFTPRPVVGIISENHPYVLAMMLAVWKLRGVVVPMDPHAPAALVEGMVKNINPTFVLLPSTDTKTKKLVEGLLLDVMAYDIETATITQLLQEFVHISPELPQITFPPPIASDLAVLIHTSSASSFTSLKCAQLSHRSILANATSQRAWMLRTFPDSDLIHLRVLGWLTWTHIMGLSHDIVVNTFLTYGTYVFALTPSAYPADPTSAVSGFQTRENVKTAGDVKNKNRGDYGDIVDRLMEALVSKSVHAFACVPWVLHGFRKIWMEETDGQRKAEMIFAFDRLKLFFLGGAKTEPESMEWAREHRLPLVMGIGMTEFGGALFLGDGRDTAEGWPIKSLTIPDAVYILMGEDGTPNDNEGELYVTSSLISQGYHNFDNSSFVQGLDGCVMFKTGDIWVRTQDDYLVWKGRKEDFIQLLSGEKLDPRPLEELLDACPAVHRSTIVGNNFLNGPAQSIFAIIELAHSGKFTRKKLIADVTKVVASINKSLSPPLRIAWSRILILEPGEEVPITKKGGVFRKRMEGLFSDRLQRLLKGRETKLGNEESGMAGRGTPASLPKISRDEVAAILPGIVSSGLGLAPEIVVANTQVSFAELGMDSAMAIVIVNTLNNRFKLDMPANTCHKYIDLEALTNAICEKLGIIPVVSPSKTMRPTRPQSLNSNDEVVIIGQALRLPGDINSVSDFWSALCSKRTDIMTMPTRWDHASFYRPPSISTPPRPCDISFEKAGFIDIEHFDNTFFGITGAEAKYVAPAVRLALETSFEALEDANIPTSKLKGSDMSVFVATGLDEGYGQLLFLDDGYGAYARHYGTGVANSTACGRLSYILDVHGPCLAVDTACSGGLVALDQDTYSLGKARQRSFAQLTHTLGQEPSAQGMVSPNSRCATFSSEADGYVASEGVVSLVLKRRSAAVRDGDNILAVIKSVVTRHNGRSQGLVAPNIMAQVDLQEILMASAGIAASKIDFIEAHGTGTKLGDLIEIQGVSQVFEGSHTGDNPLVIGAGKSCIGHTETASGLVGVVKAILSLEHRAVPGITHLTKDNLHPAIDVKSGPICIPVDTTTLREEGTLRGMVLSYGFAGTIAGTILEQPQTNPLPVRLTAGGGPMIFTVSARSQAALTEYLQRYVIFCKDAYPSQFQDICYTSFVGRDHHRHRFSCVVRDLEDLVEKLEEKLNSVRKIEVTPETRNVIFAFPGQGSQYQGMALPLASKFSGFRTFVETAAEEAARLSGYPIKELLLSVQAPEGFNIDQSEMAQICIFIYQYSMARWLQTLGVKCSAVIGHSLGEISAAVIAEAFTFEFGLKFVILRGRLLRANPEKPGAMAAIVASEQQIRQYIERLELQNDLVIAVYNGGKNHVASGAAEGIARLISLVKMEGLRATKLNIDQGFHSPSIWGELATLKTWLQTQEEQLGSLKLPLFSTVKGTRLPAGSILPSDYWVTHAREPVRLAQSLNEITRSKELYSILDIGPQPSIWTAVRNGDFNGIRPLKIVAKQSGDQEIALLEGLAALYEVGAALNLDKLYEERNEEHLKIRIPTYPFQRRRFYPEYFAARDEDHIVRSHKSPSLTHDFPLTRSFPVTQALHDLLNEHKIGHRRVVPGAGLAEFFLRQSKSNTLAFIHFHQPLVINTVEANVYAKIRADDGFTLFQDDEKVCSGILGGQQKSTVSPRPGKSLLVGAAPGRVLRHHEVYNFQSNVSFGPAFMNIQELQVWDDHADATIAILPSGDDTVDSIRKLDPCLHMFGAITTLSDKVPQRSRMEGSFLPLSLEKFSTFVEKLPEIFKCRYYLPFEIARNYHLVAASFDIISLNGDLLARCDRYSVVWVPASDSVPKEAIDQRWMKYSWITRPLPQAGVKFLPHKSGTTLLVVGSPSQTSLLESLAAWYQESPMFFVGAAGSEQGVVPRNYKHLQHNNLLEDNYETFRQFVNVHAKDIEVILDFTAGSPEPSQSDFSLVWKQALDLFKVLATTKARVNSFLLLTMSSLPADSRRPSPHTLFNGKSTPFVSALLQGMLRVFRQEFALGEKAWTVDVSAGMTKEEIIEVLGTELFERDRQSPPFPTIAYTKTEGFLIRQTPTLVLTSKAHERQDELLDLTGGAWVIVGVGSIGLALAENLVHLGVKEIFLLGRKAPNHPEITPALSTIAPYGEYVQTDILTLSSLTSTLQEINGRCEIRYIVHTAGVIEDATIVTVSSEAFERVIQPKVLGSWNLHLASESLGLRLNAFTMLSSISVPLGNPGQVAYVAGNSFMDSLAAYRNQSGLPTTSIQLGAWQSRLTSSLDLSRSIVRTISHKEGIPLLLGAISRSRFEAIQVVADLDLNQMSRIPKYASESLFQNLWVGKNYEHQDPHSLIGDVPVVVETCMRTVLELSSTEKIDFTSTLTSTGVDSIAFAQIRGEILKTTGIEVPMSYLAETYTIGDMILFVQQNCSRNV